MAEILQIVFLITCTLHLCNDIKAIENLNSHSGEFLRCYFCA